jgi:hypothetical protein
MHRRRLPAAARARRLAGVLGVVALLVAGCSDLGGQPPQPTPQDFSGIAGQLQLQGLTIDRVISGDAGCSDARLIPTAIGFDVSGLGVASPIRARVFLFANDAAYQRRRPDVDTCTAAWSSDPANVEFVDVSPFVLVVQGPIPQAFKAALVRTITIAAGRGA